MKKSLFVFLSLALIVIAITGCKDNKKVDSNDPISVIEAISNDVSEHGDDWNETEWEAAANKLEEAIDNLPEPLETDEEIRLHSAMMSIEISAGRHQRKAARMLEVLEDYKNMQNDNESSSDDGLDGDYDLQGTVGNQPVSMHLHINGKHVLGQYSYDKSSSSETLDLSGTYEDGVMELNETVNDVPTGHFKGKFSNGFFRGTFVSAKGKNFAFELRENGADDSGISYVDDGDDYDYSSDDYDDIDVPSSSSYASSSDVKGSAEVDRLLDSYEKYVDQYIKFAKKLANDDMSVLSEYPGLYRRTMDLTTKLEKCNEQMSVAQIERMNRLTMKMASAIEEIEKYQR